MTASAPSCPHCGHENHAAARFCAGCGRGLSRVCGRCRAAVRVGARFCDQCGTPVDAPERGARPPGDYTPRHLAERILRGRAALEGQRKHVTVLFADIQGSVELAAELDPEVWHEVMNRFFEVVARGVHRFEGTVNQYTGDGAMALFGAPVALEEHPQRACQAALFLRDELRGLAEDVKRTRGLGFSTRIGLNSGEVVVGKIGDDLRMDYTAQGHTVSLAARMEQLAAPGNVYLTEATERLVRGFIESRDLGAFDVKGVAEPVRVFELQGPGPHRTRLDRARARGLSRFVSRSDESGRLDAALASAAGGLRIVGLAGEGGVGKSRLCFEFLERCRAAGHGVLETHAPSHARSVPLIPWQTLFRDLLGHDETDDAEAARERIAGRLLRLVPGSLDALPVLYEFLGVPESDGPAAPDAERRQDLLLELMVDALRARSGERPAVLLWEDLHWIDDASDRLLARLVDALAEVPLLLLVNFRPGYRAPWMLSGGYREISLEPLGLEGARELLDDLLGADPATDALAARLVERTGGNPFFLEEVVLSLIESGRLVGRRGAYRWQGAVDALEVPPSVQTVLAARIDRLGESARQVIEAASVIGKRFAELLLRRVSGLPEPVCAAALDELCAAELIYAEQLQPSAEYAFKHPLTQDVAYHSQLGEGRRAMHARIAQEIASLGGRHADERAGVIAHHLERGGQPLEAARWHAVAAERTRFIDASATVFHWQRVRATTATSADDPESVELRVRACWSALDVGGRAALPLADAVELFDEGMQLSGRVADPDRARVYLHEAMAGRLGWSGDPEGESEHLAQAVSLAEGLPDPDVQLSVLHRSFVAEFHRGNLREALELTTRGVALAERSPDIQREQSFLYREQLLSKANASLHLGDLAACDALLDAADEIAQRLGSARYGSRTMHTRALIGVNRAVFGGDAERALREAREFVALTVRTGSAWGGVVARSALGRALLLSGDGEGARAELEEALELARTRQVGLESEPATLAYLADALLACGRDDEARSVARRAVELAAARGAGFWELHAQLARARAHGPAGEETQAALARARELIARTGGEILRSELESLERATP